MGERGYVDEILPLSTALGDPAEEVRKAARNALEAIGEVVWLENGGGILTHEGDIAFIPGVTAESVPRLPRTPVFEVAGASHTSLLRVAVGDTYLDGAWLPDEQEGLSGGVDGVGFRPDDIRSLQADGTGGLNSIFLHAAGPAQLILSGYLPTSLHAESFSSPVTYWLQSHTVTAEDPPSRYSWDATVYDYSQEQLNAAETWTSAEGLTYTELPNSAWVERVLALANEITAGHATPYAKAKAVEQHLRAGYTYRFASNSADIAPLPGQDPIASFLFDSREGTCGVFSSAFVVLARSVGIPARVVSGWSIAETAESQTVYTGQAHPVGRSAV